MSGLVDLSRSTVVTRPDAFCVAERDGAMPLHGDHLLGLYREDCRHRSASCASAASVCGCSSPTTSPAWSSSSS